HPVVTAQVGVAAGVPDRAGVVLAVVAERVVFRGDHERGRQAGEVVLEQGGDTGIAAVAAVREVLAEIPERFFLGESVADAQLAVGGGAGGRVEHRVDQHLESRAGSLTGEITGRDRGEIPAGTRDRQVPGRVQGRGRALQAEHGGVRGPDVRGGQSARPGTRFLLRDQLPQPRVKLRQCNSLVRGLSSREPATATATATDIIPRSPPSSQRARVTRPWVLAVLPPI